MRRPLARSLLIQGGAISANRWTPASLGSALGLWLDAADASTITLNGSTVSQWNDKSGRGFDLTQPTAANQPTYSATGLNSLPTVSSDGSDSLSRSNVDLLRNVGQATIAIVVEYSAIPVFTANASEMFVSSGTLLTNSRMLLSPNANSSNANSLGGRRLDSDAFTPVASSTGSLALRGSPFLKIGQLDYQNAQANHWTNGTQDLTAATFLTAGNTSNTTALVASIFAGAAAMPSGTKISEVLVIENTISTQNLRKIEGYLAWKWRLQANLPFGHPFRNRPPSR